MVRYSVRKIVLDTKSSLKRLSEKITEINQRYAEPKIKMSKSVKIVLFLLRVYLIFLVLLLAYKFWTIVR